MDANNVKNPITKIWWTENELSNKKIPIELIKDILSLIIIK